MKKTRQAGSRLAEVELSLGRRLTECGVGVFQLPIRVREIAQTAHYEIHGKTKVYFWFVGFSGLASFNVLGGESPRFEYGEHDKTSNDKANPEVGTVQTVSGVLPEVVNSVVYDGSHAQLPFAWGIMSGVIAGLIAYWFWRRGYDKALIDNSDKQ
jgi:hypothetical protein